MATTQPAPVFDQRQAATDRSGFGRSADHGVSLVSDGVIADNGRASAFPILRLFLDRRSSRAFSGDAVSRQQIATLLEAARWAPSSFNEQPWRFVVTFRDGPRWTQFLSWLSDSNRSWCDRAGAIVLVVAQASTSRRAPHAFDTGAAWAHLALQAVASGLIAHAVAGFDRERAEEELAIPFSFHVVCMVAVGMPGRTADLPERLRLRETASQRRPLQEIAFDSDWNRQFSTSGQEARMPPSPAFEGRIMDAATSGIRSAHRGRRRGVPGSDSGRGGLAA